MDHGALKIMLREAHISVLGTSAPSAVSQCACLHPGSREALTWLSNFGKGRPACRSSLDASFWIYMGVA